MEKRRLLITVRSAHDIKKRSLLAGDSVYVVVELTGLPEDATPSATSAVSHGGGDNPVFNEELLLILPPPQPGVLQAQLLVRVWQQIRFLPDRLLASGSVQLPDIVMYAGGKEDVTVALTDKSGNDAGHLHLSLEMQSATPTISSAAGKVISEAVLPPQGVAAEAPRADMHPSSAGAPVTPMSDAIVVGGVMDPSKPSFGVML